MTLHIVPTSRARRSYIDHHDNDSFIPHIITIGDFFAKTIDIGDKYYIDEEERFLYLKEAIKIDNFYKLGISSNFSDFLKQSHTLIRFMTEMSQEMVKFEDLQTADTYEYYQEHLSILKEIYHNYKRLLEQKGCIDTITLEDQYTLNHNYLSSFDTIELFLEGYLTQRERLIIQQVATSYELIIHLSTNQYNQKVWHAFNEVGFSLVSDYTYSLNLSQKRILFSERVNPTMPILTIKSFASRLNQIAFIKSELVRMIHQGIEAKDIVVILPDETMKPFLETFDQEGYFNYAMGHTIYTTSLYQWFFAIYEYIHTPNQKNQQRMDTLTIPRQTIDQHLVPQWNHTLTETTLDQLIELVLAYDDHASALLEALDSILYRLKKLFFLTHTEITFKDAYTILLNQLGTVRLDDTQGGPITVMGLLETRGVHFKGVILIDFNEGIVPQVSLKDKFFSTSVKKSANLPTHKDRESLQKYYYKQLIDNAEHASISYVNNNASHISRFGRELFHNTKMESRHWDEAYSPILFTSSSLTHFNDEIQLPLNLSTLSWSASSLKDYLQCKRQFYFKRIIHLNPHHFSLKPESFQLGNTIHTILEEFYQTTNTLPPNPEKKLIELFNRHKSDNPFLHLDLEVWKKRLLLFVDHERVRFDQGVIIHKREHPFDIHYRGIQLKGQIDRIDQSKDSWYILDYKTSSSLKVDTIKTYDTSVDFQLEFYYLALKSLYPDSSKPIRPYYYDLYNTQLREESMLDQKIERLNTIFDTLETSTVNFTRSKTNTPCQFCDYKTLCNR